RLPVMCGHRFPLGEFHARDLAERGDEAAPVGALLRQDPPAGLGDAVVTPAALTGLLDAAALDPPAILEPVQRRIQRCERDALTPGGPLLDQFRDLVPVMAFLLHDGQDDELRAAFLGFVNGSPNRHVQPSYMMDGYISHALTGPAAEWLALGWGM